MLAAARLGDYKFVRSILKIDQEFVLDRDKHGRNALIWAAKKNQHKMIRTLLRWTALDILETDTDGNTPIHWASRRAHGSLIAQMLAKSEEFQGSGSTRGLLTMTNNKLHIPIDVEAGYAEWWWR